MKRLNRQKGMYALLIAVAACIGITINGSCSADEDYDGYSSKDELLTLADGMMGRGENPPTFINCGKWALMQLGADGNMVQALIDSKLKDHDNEITNNLIYEIGQELLGFTVHKFDLNDDSTKIILINHMGDTAALHRMIVYKDDFEAGHAGIAQSVTNKCVTIRDQGGTQDFYFSDETLGVMY